MLKNVTLGSTLLVMTCVASFCAHAVADEARKIDVPAGELATALRVLAKQSGVEFVYSADQLKGVRTIGAHGEYTTEEAVTKLLEGTNLKLTVHPTGALLISDLAADHAGSVGGNDTSPRGENSRRAFWSRFQLAQARRASDASTSSGAAIAAASGTSLAQQSAREPGTSTSSELIDEVTVAGKRIEQTLPLELAEYGHRVQLIDAEELEKRAIIDVAQALQSTAPSIYIQQRSGPFDYVDISLQGSRSDEILWLVDGIRINNRLYNSTTPLDTIPAAMLERIEVLEGGQGLMYGTQAAAGVINVITKSFSREWGGQAAVGLDSNDGRHVSGYTRGSQGAHAFVLYASSDDADGYQPIVTRDYQPSSTDRDRGYEVRTVGAKYAFDVNDRVRLSAGYQHTNADLEFPRGTLVSNFHNERVEGIANGKIDWAVTDAFGLFVKAYHHYWDSEVFRVNNSIGNPGETVTVNSGTYWGYKDYGVNALAKFAPRAGGMEYYFGFDQQNFNGRDDFIRMADRDERINAFIVQVRSGESDFEKLKLAAGVRYSLPKEGDEFAAWNVSGNYEFSDSLFMRASIGTSYALPDAGQLFGIDTCCVRGNPALGGEESTNLNISIGGRASAENNEFGWEIVAFARDVDDLIRAVDDGSGTGDLVYDNTNATSKIRGWTAMLHGSLGRTLSANLSHSAVDAKLGGSDLQVDRVPRDTTKFFIDYRAQARPVGASLTIVRRGQTFLTLSSGLGRLPLGAAITADVSGYLEFGAKRNQRLTGRIQNVTDKAFVSYMQREFTDAERVPYAVRMLGVPRTYSVLYSYSF